MLSLAVGGSPVASWAEGSDLNLRLLDNLKAISGTYKVTDMVWHQGEIDRIWGVGQSQYFVSFASLKKTIDAQGIAAPLFMSIASFCYGGAYPNSITMAQMQLANELEGVQIGVNTDELVTSDMRQDNCHFNLQGQNVAAQKLAEIISNYHTKQ